MSCSELEISLLRALLIQPALLESCDLRDSDFLEVQLRNTFSGIVGLWKETRPNEIDPVLLANRLGGNGTFSFVSSLMDSSISLDLKLFNDRIRELRRRAISRRIRTKLQQQERMPELDLRDIRPDLEALDRLRDDTAQPGEFLKTGRELQAMDLRSEYTIEKLQPSRSLLMIHARSGGLKTFLALNASRAISAGVPFLGLATKRRPVLYVDFEMPLTELIKRVRLLDIQDVKFWHLSFTTPPPKLDGPDWTIYKKILEPDSVIIFDTLRSAHDGDENSSQDAAVIMSRLKELRELGHDVIVLHHTGKASDRIYKGSTAFADLADHVLDFHRVRQGSLEEVDDEDCDDPDALLSLGTGKTRFLPFRIFLTFDQDRGTFSVAPDPKAEKMDELAAYIAGEGLGKNQSDLVDWAKAVLGIKKRDTLLAMLKRGEGSRWQSHRGFQRSKIYEPI